MTFEPRDINVGTVVKQLIYLAITIVIALLICVPILKVLTVVGREGRHADGSGAGRPWVRRAATARHIRRSRACRVFPVTKRTRKQDLRDKIAADTTANESIGWVDKANGIAKIPVKDAMKIIAERGGAAASSGVATPEKKK